MSEDEVGNFEGTILHALIDTLFETRAIDELEPLVPRFREVSKAESRRLGGLFSNELLSVLASARLHEVLCLPS